MLSFLEELGAESAHQARTVYLAPGLSPSQIEEELRPVVAPRPLSAELLSLAAGSKTGVGLFWGPGRQCMVLPPFPLKTSLNLPGYDAGILRNTLEKDCKIALILIRLGAYAIGVCQGERLIERKVGTGLVHGRHKKGGSSQQRFQRHREKQIEQFLERVCGHLREYVWPRAGELDYVVYGGARTTILLLKKRGGFLGDFDNRELEPLLTVPAPDKHVLESSVRRIWSSRVITLSAD